MGKLTIWVFAGVSLLIIIGWAATSYFPSGVSLTSTSTSSGSATTLSHSPASGASSSAATKSQSASSGSWLPDSPAFVGNASKIDYPPGYGELANFTLAVINKDRAAAGVSPVTLSDVPSGQQHADSMAYYRYFSHWDNQGMKPYMRYTVLGGIGSMAENAALNYCNTSPPDSPHAIAAPCSIQTIENAISGSEWAMMNNDTTCCNDGHRANILAPMHNRVSVGIAYNSTTVYLVQDFEDSYFTSGSIQVSSGVVTFQGSMYQDIPGWMRSSSGAEIAVYYDPTPGKINLSELALLTSCDHYNQLKMPPSCQYQGAYTPGTQISTVFGPCPARFVCSGGNYTYAQVWQESSGNFEIIFSMSELISAHGNGVYTFYLWPAASAPGPITSLSIFVKDG